MTNNYYVLPVEFGTPEFDETIRLRDKILRKPLNMEFTVEQISEEHDQIHLACYNERVEIVGCLVLKRIDESNIKMRQVAVDNDIQKAGVGTKLVQASEVFAKSEGFKIMELNARDVAIPFYQKLKYKKVGKQFEEVGIKHYRMEKKLS